MVGLLCDEVVLPEHLFRICTILGPTRCYRFPTFWFGQMKPMGKSNASVGENILLRFLRDKNAEALVWPGPELQLTLGGFRGSLYQFPFSINQLVVENFI